MTLLAVYDKLSRLEREIRAALVGDSSDSATQMIHAPRRNREPLTKSHQIYPVSPN